MSKFNPNEHSDKPLRVYVKRLNEYFAVSYINTLKGKNGITHVWGFAYTEDGRPVEFDTSWGDIVGVDL